MGLILGLGIGLIVGSIIALPFVFIALPVIIGFASGTEQTIGAGLITAGLCIVIYLPILIVINGIMLGYIQSAWTLTYLRVTGMDGSGPIEVKAIEPESDDSDVI